MLVNEEALKHEILRIINMVRNAKTKEDLRKIYMAFVYKKYINDDVDEKYYEYVARPEEIDPRKIMPKLVVVSTKKERELFKYLSYYWSFPVSEGIGRRIKILVFDEQNGKVIGLIGLKDPVIALGPRDRHIGWDEETKIEYLNHVMDVHVLGAIPPYNALLGGKLIACLLRSRELNEIIARKFTFKHGFPVVLYTTITVYGKSTMLSGTEWLYIGETKGTSTFHLDYAKLRELVGEDGKKYKFEHGPNYPLRLAKLVSKRLGFDITKVGIKRGIYVLPLSSNYRDVLNGRALPAFDLVVPLNNIACSIKERYIIPRSNRVGVTRAPRVSELMEIAKEYYLQIFGVIWHADGS